MTTNIDHDQLFKRLLREFFLEFVELFLPAAMQYLKPDSIEFLDKEIFADGKDGQKQAARKQVVDLAAKCRFKDRDAFFLIHVEPESSRRRRRGEFGRRMFHYFAMLTKERALPVYPVALLSYDKPRDPELDTFRVKFPDKVVLEFRFTVIQLNRLNWRDYLRRDNPVASALMAKMGFAPEERVEVKKECLRMIVRLKLDQEKTDFLSTFVDNYLRLNAQEEKRFQAAINELPNKEREATMELTTSWFEQGLEQGLERERELVLRLLVLQLGALSKRTEARIRRLSIEQVESLGEAMLKFTDTRDIAKWLREHSPHNKKSAAQVKSR